MDPVREKIIKARMKWFGHVNGICQTTEMSKNTRRKKIRRPGGKLQRKWTDYMTKDNETGRQIWLNVLAGEHFRD